MDADCQMLWKLRGKRENNGPEESGYKLGSGGEMSISVGASEQGPQGRKEPCRFLEIKMTIGVGKRQRL